MRSLKLSLAAAIVMCGLSASAQADCVKVGAIGQNLTHDLAELFATNALKNIIYGQGRVGKGPVSMKCEEGVGSTTCHSTQVACQVTTPKTCFGAWFCLPG